jgi:hypothetical protein
MIPKEDPPKLSDKFNDNARDFIAKCLEKKVNQVIMKFI